MNKIIIKVEGLGKKYLIRHQKQGRQYVALRDEFADGVKAVARRIFTGAANHDVPDFQKREAFWALKDICLEIKQGDRLGIIGRNGAGKSTLLKVLSRITEPSLGKVTIKGRVASLLEVGTGFHPELTGRENIYLNGAILGMRKDEIKKKFDEIVAFSEVEKFLDTPVKRYSSGMYVRLAFSVAAHLEPEILIVDEVLAVGDASFQKKCLGKMDDVAKGGRTVLFVSHNMSAIQSLCTKVLRLDNGLSTGMGDVDEQIAAYVKDTIGASGRQYSNIMKLESDIELRRFEFQPNPVFSGDNQEFTIELGSAVSRRIDALAILIYSSSGSRVAVIDLRKTDVVYRLDADNTLCISGAIKGLPLVDGVYRLGLYVSSEGISKNYFDLLDVGVVENGSGDSVQYPANVRGVVCLDYIFK